MDDLIDVSVTPASAITAAAVIAPRPPGAGTTPGALGAGLSAVRRFAASWAGTVVNGTLDGRARRPLPLDLADAALDRYATIAHVAGHHGGRLPDADDALRLARRLLWDLADPEVTPGQRHATAMHLQTLAERVEAADHRTARLDGHPAVDDLLGRLGEHTEAQRLAHDEIATHDPHPDRPR